MAFGLEHRSTGRFGTKGKELAARQRGIALRSPEDKNLLPDTISQDTAGLQQEQLAPGVGALQRGLRELGAQRFGSATEREDALRAGTRGAGEALGSLQAAAARTAEGIGRGRQQFALQRQQLASQERARQEETAERAAIRRSTPLGGGGGGLTEASLRLATRPGFQGTVLDRPSDSGANISFNPTASQTAAIEQQGLDELRALSGGGIEQQLGGVF